MSASLVGSEMCIRDRSPDRPRLQSKSLRLLGTASAQRACAFTWGSPDPCLLYTSDAADDM
eukprot:7266083-Alexandrium_andersonii.AAC.1